jgi:hypothetical protein
MAASLREAARFDRSAFSLPVGLRAGTFVALPVLIGLATGQSEFIFATLGALFVTNTEGPRTLSAPLRLLLTASILESAAFGLGTLAGTTGLLAIPLMCLGLLLGLSLAVYPGYALTAMFTGILFAVGVGLPGDTVEMAGVRLVFSLLGGLWALLGVWLGRRIGSRRASNGSSAAAQSPSGGTPAPHSIPGFLRSAAFGHALIVAVASSVGLAIGTVLGLPRDFWVVVTIVLAIRPGIGPTVVFTLMIVVGTAVGAAIAAAVTLGVGNAYALWVLLLFFSIVLFYVRGVNLGLTQVFLTPFIIVLLNILYPGEWQLAEVRILDVAIGGAISVLTVYLLAVRWPKHESATRNAGVPVGPSDRARQMLNKLTRRIRCGAEIGIRRP